MRKGFFEIGITAAVLACAIAVASVLIFFYVFKVNVDLQMREQYLWNKVQDVPMDLLSMDVEGESFVYRMNKVYYGYEEESNLGSKTSGYISKQLIYFLEGPVRPLEAVIVIDDISIVKYLEGCTVNSEAHCEGGDCAYVCKCSAGCSKPEGDIVGSTWMTDTCKEEFLDKCLYTTNTRVQYSANFPFPLTFNGTDKLVDELSYKAVQVV
jgi:hypothetical protein